MRIKKNRTILQLKPIEHSPVEILSDPLIASKGFGEGRMIPELIIDAYDRPDIREFFEVHGHIQVGDVESAWAQSLRNADAVMLVLQIRRPMALTILIDFEIPRRAGLVDLILRSRSLYLQLGKPGQRILDVIDEPRIAFEVLGTFPNWDEILEKALYKDFRNSGLKRSDAKRATREFMRDWRQFGDIRF